MQLYAPRTLKGHKKGGILDLIFSEDSVYCLTCGQDGNVNLWNPWRGTLIKSYEGVHHAEVTGAALTKCRSKFISVGAKDRTGFMWDVSTGNIIRRCGFHEQGMTGCQLIGNDNVLITWSPDKTIAFWDLRVRDNKKEPLQVFNDALDTVTSAIMLDGNTDLISTSLDGFLRSYDFRSGLLKSDFLHHPLTNLSVSHDKSTQCVLVSCLGVSELKMIDRMNKEECSVLNTFAGHVNKISKLHPIIDNTDSLILAPSEDGFIYIWDIATEDPNRHKNVIRRAHPGSIVNGIRQVKNTSQTRQYIDSSDNIFPTNFGVEMIVEMGRECFISFAQDGDMKLWFARQPEDDY